MSLHQLVIDGAKKEPNRPAVVGSTDVLTYAELNRMADGLAHRLRHLGVRQGDRVVIWSEKSGIGLAGMQAVLRLGAAYVPADDAAPAARVAFQARDCGARVILTTARGIRQIKDEIHGDTVLLDLATPIDAAPEPINQAVAADDLAYILYTSGSTGIPKGVCISHRNARAFVDWVVAEIDPAPDDCFSSHAPLTFDLSVLDLYAAFAVQASVHLIPAELAYAPTQLVEFLYQQKITIWYSVPSVLTLMMRDGGLLRHSPPRHLRAVLFAGEPFPIAQLRDLAGWTDARLLNLYGPTETNVCTFHEITPGDLLRQRPAPIGVASCGDQVWARTLDGTVCGPGNEGELIVEGPTVMLGYWGRESQQGPYATGDIVRVLEDGSFDYVGRRDHMVKVRGNRIELGEVEAALAAHPDVSEAGAVVVGDGLAAQLVAFVVPRPGCTPGRLALRRHCAERLPRYMVADQMHIVAVLPRTRNGKIDRAALISSLSAR